jgi:hypothetical protein
MNVSIDYIPKNQAKIFTYAKEQLDILKNGAVAAAALSKKTQLITLMNLRL